MSELTQEELEALVDDSIFPVRCMTCKHLGTRLGFQPCWECVVTFGLAEYGHINWEPRRTAMIEGKNYRALAAESGCPCINCEHEHEPPDVYPCESCLLLDSYRRMPQEGESPSE